MSYEPEENECCNCGDVFFGSHGRCGHCYENTDGSTYMPSQHELDAEAAYEEEQEREWAERQARIRELICWSCHATTHGPVPTCCKQCRYEMVSVTQATCDECKQSFSCSIDWNSQHLQCSAGRKLCDACMGPPQPCCKCSKPRPKDEHRYMQFRRLSEEYQGECMHCHMKWGVYYIPHV